MSTWTPESVETTFERLKERARNDPQFKALALKDAKAAIQQINPTPLPGGIEFSFLEDTSSDLSVSFSNSAMADGELSDAELDAVAGGKMSGSDPRKDQGDA